MKDYDVALTTSMGEDELLAETKAFGERLKEARIKSNQTQEDVAQALGVKRQTLGSWEQGDTTPDVKTILKLRQVLASGGPLDIAALMGEVRWDLGSTPLAYPIRLLQTIDSMGIRNAYLSRTDALAGFYQVLAQETHSITVVCSSFMGVMRVAPQKVGLLLKGKAKSLKWRILMTHPKVSRLREQQEDRRPGSIEQEIIASVGTLTNGWGIPRDSIRFYKGAPTLFMMFTPDRGIVNPYTYGTEAFKTFTLEVARTAHAEDIFSQYVLNHFQSSWDGNNAVTLDDFEKESPADGGDDKN
jgi:transcriptional regulator with XRE-family HTH domain